MTAIHPSILNCDIVHLTDELNRATGDVDADELHVDVMDNHFVPNLSWRLSVIKAVFTHFPLPVDTYPMIHDADRWALVYAKTGCQIVTPRAEVMTASAHLACELHRLGAGVGTVLKPATPLEAVADVLGEFDPLLPMTVELGFGSQTLVEPMLSKIRRACKLVGTRGFDLQAQVGGDTTAQAIKCMTETGADVFVAGSVAYRANDVPAAICEPRGAVSSRHHDARGRH